MQAPVVSVPEATCRRPSRRAGPQTTAATRRLNHHYQFANSGHPGDAPDCVGVDLSLGLGHYREPTGWAAPAASGPCSKDMTADRRAVDREARLKISAELGHEREQITVVDLRR